MRQKRKKFPQREWQKRVDGKLKRSLGGIRDKQRRGEQRRAGYLDLSVLAESETLKKEMEGKKIRGKAEMNFLRRKYSSNRRLEPAKRPQKSRRARGDRKKLLASGRM